MSVDVRPGDEIRLPFLIVADDAIVNISDGTVTGTLWGARRTKLSDLTVGSGIVIEQTAPAPAATLAGQVAHGLVVIDEALSARLDLGLVNRIDLVFVNSAGVRMSTESILLKGVSC